MRRDEFRIGTDFIMSGNRWRCTDIGTRTICAIKLDERDASWFTGPPYAVAEFCVDEYDMDACETLSTSEDEA